MAASAEKFVAVWPFKFRLQKEVIVPASFVRNNHELSKLKKGDVVTYKTRKDARSSFGQFLMCGDSVAEITAAFADATKRIRFPARVKLNLREDPSASEGEIAASQQKKAKNAAAAALAKMGAEANSQQILKQFQQRTISQLDHRVGPAKELCTAAVSTAYTAKAHTSQRGEEIAEGLERPSLKSMKAGKVSKAKNTTNNPYARSSQHQRPPSATPDHSLPLLAAAPSSSTTNLQTEGIDVSTALQEMRRIHDEIVAREASTAALSRQAAEDLRCVQQVLEDIKKERQQCVKEREKVEVMQEVLVKEKEAAMKALQTAVGESADTLDKQRMSIVATMNKKIEQFEGIVSSASSSSSKASASSGLSGAPSESVSLDGNVPDINERINIGGGVQAIAHYWRLAKSACSQGQWARYAMQAVYGEDAKLYRATTPRTTLYKFRVISPNVVNVLRQHYRIFLKANPSVMWDTKAKRRRPKNNVVESDSYPDSENDVPLEHSHEETKLKLKQLIEGLPGKMADKAIEMWRKWLSQNPSHVKGTSHDKSSKKPESPANHSEHAVELVECYQFEATDEDEGIRPQTPTRNPDEVEWDEMSPHSRGYARWRNDSCSPLFDSQGGFDPQVVSTEYPFLQSGSDTDDNNSEDLFAQQ